MLTGGSQKTKGAQKNEGSEDNGKIEGRDSGSLMIDGEETAQYKIIELPDSIKELDIQDFSFDASMGVRITFHT